MTEWTNIYDDLPPMILDDFDDPIIGKGRHYLSKKRLLVSDGDKWGASHITVTESGEVMSLSINPVFYWAEVTLTMKTPDARATPEPPKETEANPLIEMHLSVDPGMADSIEETE